MKKIYSAPKMTVHGTMEKLTQVLGPDATEDTLSFDGEVLGTSDDSISVVLP
ncbi:MAG: lasso peptide [Cyanothece sp. SIO1E1]|nr:lasso peptide [Cyanothece sp. SIO1E1]